MKTIISYERTTGAGARHGTQFRTEDGEWHFVSASVAARPAGRKEGFSIWEMPAFEGAQVREHHRSNSGTVRIADGRMLDGPRTEPEKE